MVGVLGAASEMAYAGSSSHAAVKAVTVKPTVVNVIAGKPSELAFKVTNFSLLTAGTIMFKVKNEGVAFHDFKLCVTPVKNTAHNACVGKGTAILKPGQTATLTVKLTKKGLYEYICSVPGHAAAGMKGLIGVGVKVTVPKTSTTTATTTAATTTAATTTAATTTAATTTAATTTTSGGGGDGCPNGSTIQQQVTASGSTDRDGDDAGGPTDGDGCI